MSGKGYIHLYCGNGKGKTTASLGLAFRAAGAGMKTFMVQFMKGQPYSELKSSQLLNGLITIEQYGSKKFCMPDGENFSEHYELVRKGLKRAEEILAENTYNILILDEIVTSTIFKLISMDEILKLIDKKPENMELILTGRGATQELIDRCDLVTEMKEIKHYYTAGVLARTGIEN